MTEPSQVVSHDHGEDPDLADVVQMLRVLGAAAVFTLNPPVPPKLAFVRFDDDAGLKRAIKRLIQTAAAASDPKTRAQAKALCTRLRRLRRALFLRPRRPTDDELVWRYVSGEIDGSTACSIADWSETDLVRACEVRGFSKPEGEQSWG